MTICKLINTLKVPEMYVAAFAFQIFTSIDLLLTKILTIADWVCFFVPENSKKIWAPAIYTHYIIVKTPSHWIHE